MLLIIFCFAFVSCSPIAPKSSGLPNYSDMGAAADAGRVQP